ncbi:hypothetical protein CCACVL1_26506 [Corchorus capsularis]|uniref:Uncharacterized protein n=1 Tax=Corchorus capsularis TaxID=210143 RepID=A0A1R3GEH3_COCAP|nr:hypothetical protein CCACVL1_26506 [Corchorus capsularis]
MNMVFDRAQRNGIFNPSDQSVHVYDDDDDES